MGQLFTTILTGAVNRLLWRLRKAYFQKVAFRKSKGHLLDDKRPSFAT